MIAILYRLSYMKTLLIYIKHLILRIMKIAAKCPTCATYTNSVCVLYQGSYLSNLDIAPLTNLEEIIRIIDNKVQLRLGFTPENVANKSTNVLLGTSDILYPTQKAVKTYVDSSISAIPVSTIDEVLGAGDTALNKKLKLDFNIGSTPYYGVEIDPSLGGKILCKNYLVLCGK